MRLLIDKSLIVTLPLYLRRYQLSFEFEEFDLNLELFEMKSQNEGVQVELTFHPDE